MRTNTEHDVIAACGKQLSRLGGFRNPRAPLISCTFYDEIFLIHDTNYVLCIYMHKGTGNLQVCYSNMLHCSNTLAILDCSIRVYQSALI